MPLESIGSLLERAVRGGYAVGYFESWNIELSWYAALGQAAAESASVPCGFLFNECPSDDWVALAIESGFQPGHAGGCLGSLRSLRRTRLRAGSSRPRPRGCRRGRRMPDLATTGSPIKVLRWLVDVGQSVRRGEPLLEVETDKAVMQVESVVGGRLSSGGPADGGVWRPSPNESHEGLGVCGHPSASPSPSAVLSASCRLLLSGRCRSAAGRWPRRNPTRHSNNCCQVGS